MPQLVATSNCLVDNVYESKVILINLSIKFALNFNDELLLKYISLYSVLLRGEFRLEIPN